MAVKLNPKYLGEIERGEKFISIEALLRIAKALTGNLSASDCVMPAQRGAEKNLRCFFEDGSSRH